MMCFFWWKTFFSLSWDSHVFEKMSNNMYYYGFLQYMNKMSQLQNFTYSICSSLCPMCTDNISSLRSHQSHSDEWSLNLNVQTIDWKCGSGGEAVCHYPGCQGNSSALTSDRHPHFPNSLNTHIMERGLVVVKTFFFLLLFQYCHIRKKSMITPLKVQRRNKVKENNKITISWFHNKFDWKHWVQETEKYRAKK